MVDLFDLPEVEAPRVEVVRPIVAIPKKGLSQIKAEQLRSIEDSILERSQKVISDAMYFGEFDPEDPEPPQRWVDELGIDGARERLRMAKYALMAAKEAPVGLSIAKATFASIVKARATEKQGPRQLNVNVVNMTAPLPEFRVIEVE